MSSLIPPISRPIIIETDGVLAELTSGALINAGGTSFSTFTVGGKSLLFSDGTSTGAAGGLTLTLQSIYNNSPNIGGQAGITLTEGKDFVINDINQDGNYLVVSAADGSVTINGDLVVNGASTTINTNVIQSDHQLIAPSSRTVTALNISPTMGTVPIVDIVTIRSAFGAIPAFRIDRSGNVLISQALSVTGLINGVDIVSTSAELQAHVSGIQYQHEAAAITVTPILGLSSTTVQAAIAELYADIQAISVDGGECSDSSHEITAFGYDYVQTNPATSWAINHKGGTLLATVSVYDTTKSQIIPDSIKIIDMDNVLVTFASPIAGTALVMLVPTSQSSSPVVTVTAGTYTNATVTVTSTGAITAISSGTSGGGGGGGGGELYAENPTAGYAQPATLGSNSVAIGSGAIAAADKSLAFGEQAYTRIAGGIVQANGRFASSGDAQVGRYVIRAISGGSTPVQGFMDGPGGQVGLVLADNSTWTFRATATALRTDVPDGRAGFELRGVIYRINGAASTALQGSVATEVFSSSDPWRVSATADTVTGALKISFTGENYKTIRWVCLVETVECTE